MKPAPFDYVRPSDIGEVLDLLAEHGSDARILAGGQSIIAMLNMRVAMPKLLIDVGRLRGMDYIRESADTVAVGCAVRQVQLEAWPGLAHKLPLVGQALPWVGHVQTRNRGTVCGSIAHADPSSELPLCLATLGGEVVLRSRGGERRLAAQDFFVGALQTARRDDELLVEVRFPILSPGAGVAFNEFAVRHGDFAIVAVAAVADSGGVSVGIGGGRDYPVVQRLPATAPDALSDALNELAWSLDCQDDLHATAVYRRHLIRALGKRTIEEADACRS